MKLHTLVALGLLLVTATASADTAVYDLDAKNAKAIADAINATLNAQCHFAPEHAAIKIVRSRAAVDESAPRRGACGVASSGRRGTQGDRGPQFKSCAAASRCSIGSLWGARGSPTRPTLAQSRSAPFFSSSNVCTANWASRYRIPRVSRRSQGRARIIQGEAARDKPDAARDRRHRRSRGSAVVPPRPLISDRESDPKVSVTIKRGEFLVLAERTRRGHRAKTRPTNPKSPRNRGDQERCSTWSIGHRVSKRLSRG